MLFILAVAIGLVLGAVGLNLARNESQSGIVRAAGAVAGFIVGYAGTYIVVAHL